MIASIRALSLHRPWPWLILQAGKNVENRTWTTRYRGVIILHAARCMVSVPLRHALHLGQDRPGQDPYEKGFTGLAELTGVHHADECRTGAGLCSPWAEDGCWHWQLCGPAAFSQAVPGPGALGLFIPPREAIDAAQTATARRKETTS